MIGDEQFLRDQLRSARDQLREALKLLKECSDENDRLWAEVKRLRRPSWRERLISWIDPGPEVDR